MRKIFSAIIIIIFSIWILPLGAFIKPSQMKKACNGHRAICLCSHLIAKQKAKWAGKILLKSGGGVHKEETGPGGANHYFLVAHERLDNTLQNSSFLNQSVLLYTCQFFQSIEHVPKV